MNHAPVADRLLVLLGDPTRPGARAPIPIGGWSLSVQPSTPPQTDRWDVALFQNGHWATPETHPETFLDPLWSTYWARGPSALPWGSAVPTAVLQTFCDFLEHPQIYHPLLSYLDPGLLPSILN